MACDLLRMTTKIPETLEAKIEQLVRGHMATQQAAAIAYLYDFRLMAFVVIGSVPLLLMIKGKKRPPKEEPEMVHAFE